MATTLSNRGAITERLMVVVLNMAAAAATSTGTVPPTVTENKRRSFHLRPAFGDGCGTGIAGFAPASEPRRSGGKDMRPTLCAFAAATLICAATYQLSQAAPIAPTNALKAGGDNIPAAYSRRYRIVVPLRRDYGWWPQGQYRWFPFGVARWGYWCEPASYYRLSCGVRD